MTYLDPTRGLPAAHRPLSPDARQDITRVALLLMIFAVTALAIILAADRPNASLGSGPEAAAQSTIDWHGNVRASERR